MNMKNLDAVFLQPTFDCELQCEGCYVKESVQGKQMSYELVQRLIRELLKNPEEFLDATVEHITLAVDNLPVNNSSRATEMYLFVKNALAITYNNKLKEIRTLPSLHLTVNSTKAWDAYSGSWRDRESLYPHISPDSTPYINVGNMDGLSLISFSHLTINDINNHYIFQARRLDHPRATYKINYNYQPSGGSLDIYREILKYVDMSYLVLHKTGLGEKNNIDKVAQYKRALQEISTWTEEEQAKIIVDHCVQDAFKFLKTGNGCSANIHKLHIWPDGHVSGCPYNKRGGRVASTLEEIRENVQAAYKEYDFTQCTIPKEYPNIPQNISQISRRARSLQIID